MIISDIYFLVASFLFSWGFLKQIMKIKERKRVDDIEMGDVIARALACTLFFIKFCFIGNFFLIFGQGIILILAYFYLILVVAILLGREQQLWKLIKDIQSFTKGIAKRIMGFWYKIEKR